jgi:hypothetical protein
VFVRQRRGSETDRNSNRQRLQTRLELALFIICHFRFEMSQDFFFGDLFISLTLIFLICHFSCSTWARFEFTFKFYYDCVCVLAAPSLIKISWISRMGTTYTFTINTYFSPSISTHKWTAGRWNFSKWRPYLRVDDSTNDQKRRTRKRLGRPKNNENIPKWWMMMMGLSL